MRKNDSNKNLMNHTEIKMSNIMYHRKITNDEFNIWKFLITYTYILVFV